MLARWLLALTWLQPRSSPFCRAWGSAGPRTDSAGGGVGSSNCSRHAVPGREELFWWHRCTPGPPRRAPSSRTRSPLGGGWGEEDREDEAEEEGAESGERPPGGVTPAVPAAVAGPLATGSRCSRMRRRSVEPCSALPAPPESRGSGEEQHRLGCEEENTRSSTCFRFLKPLHLLPLLATAASASCVALGGGGDGVGVAAVRRSGAPGRAPPPPLPLPTPSCRFFQSRAWKEGDEADSGSPAAAARGSILHPRHVPSAPTASPPPRRAAPPLGACRRRRPEQQHKPGAPGGFRPARGDAAAAEALPGAAALARRT